MNVFTLVRKKALLGKRVVEVQPFEMGEDFHLFYSISKVRQDFALEFLLPQPAFTARPEQWP